MVMKRKLVGDDRPAPESVASMASSDTKTHDLNTGSELPWPRYRRHHQDASIVFVGPRATGTSSLAVIAGSILGWKIIDCDREFEKLTGRTKQQYRNVHGPECYRQRKFDIVQEALEANTERCVLACGTVMFRNKHSFFRRYAQQHPIVYVMRERKLIQNYLGITEDGEWDNAAEHMHFFFRQVSNYEFFNLDEAEEPRWQTTLTDFLERKSQNSAQAPQVLRKTRAHVSTLLRNISSPTSCTTRFADARMPPEPGPECRQGSSVLCIDLNDIRNDSEYLKSLDSGHDAVQLNITGSVQQPWHSLLSQDTLTWALAALRRQLDIPIIVNVVTPRVSDISTPTRHPKTYKLLLHLILRLAPEYLTIDLHSGDEVISEIVQAKGLTRVIGCLHLDKSLNSLWSSRSVLPQYHRARKLGCDLVTFSGLSRSMHDNMVCQQILYSIAQLGLPTAAISFNIGAFGRLSQVLNPLMTPVTPGNSRQCYKTVSTTRLDLTSSRDLEITRHMLMPADRTHFYVVGAEVRQSLSPALHNAGFDSCGLPFTYQTYESSDFSKIVELFSQPSFRGASISLPFKSEVLSFVGKQSPAVQLIGAANTVLSFTGPTGRFDVCRDKVENNNASAQLRAENTDWMGIHVCIAKHCTPANHVTEQTSALVIGAGGIARAAIYALVKLGVGHIFILNRTHGNALKLKEHFEHTCGDLESSEHDVISVSPLIPSPTFHVLRSCDEPWPEGVSRPSVIVCAIPARASDDGPEYPPELRHDWFGNPTGGLVADVSAVLDSLDSTNVDS